MVSYQKTIYFFPLASEEDNDMKKYSITAKTKWCHWSKMDTQQKTND